MAAYTNRNETSNAAIIRCDECDAVRGYDLSDFPNVQREFADLDSEAQYNMFLQYAMQDFDETHNC